MYGLERGGEHRNPLKHRRLCWFPSPAATKFICRLQPGKRGRGPSAAHMWELICSTATGVWVRQALPWIPLHAALIGASAAAPRGRRGRGSPRTTGASPSSCQNRGLPQHREPCAGPQRGESQPGAKLAARREGDRRAQSCACGISRG